MATDTTDKNAVHYSLFNLTDALEMIGRADEAETMTY
jgi:hypothetical protein